MRSGAPAAACRRRGYACHRRPPWRPPRTASHRRSPRSCRSRPPRRPARPAAHRDPVRARGRSGAPPARPQARSRRRNADKGCPATSWRACPAPRRSRQAAQAGSQSSCRRSAGRRHWPRSLCSRRPPREVCVAAGPVFTTAHMQVRSANRSTMRRFLYQNLRICRVAGQPQHARIQFPGIWHASLPTPSAIVAVIAPDRRKALMYCSCSLYWMAADEPGTKDPHLPARAGRHSGPG